MKFSWAVRLAIVKIKGVTYFIKMVSMVFSNLPYCLSSHRCYAAILKLFDSHNFYFERNTSNILQPNTFAV